MSDKLAMLDTSFTTPLPTPVYSHSLASNDVLSQVGLQAKYYAKSKGHATWGSALKSVSVQYKDSEGVMMVQDIR